ncbi:MAG: hypothetical protein ABI051_17485 [Vicinamibacterales bacterium]
MSRISRSGGGWNIVTAKAVAAAGNRWASSNRHTTYGYGCSS